MYIEIIKLHCARNRKTVRYRKRKKSVSGFLSLSLSLSLSLFLSKHLIPLSFTSLDTMGSIIRETNTYKL